MMARSKGKTIIVDDEVVVGDSLKPRFGDGYSSRTAASRWKAFDNFAGDYEVVVRNSLNRREASEGWNAGDCDLALPTFSGAGA